MSHIFDALQRSENERLEVDASKPAEATELLRRAERRARSRWETAALTKENDAARPKERGDAVALQTTSIVELPQKSPVEESSLVEERTNILRQFQSLQPVITDQSRLVCFDDESAAAEAFRMLGVRLRHLRRDRPLKKVLITSTIPQEGKSMVAANLACTLALTTQQSVLLVDGDLRRPSLSKVFGLGRNPGLCECLQGERTLANSILHIERPGLWMLPAGNSQSNALELLQSGRLSAYMAQLAAWFDWVIVDSPPVLPLADTSVWARVSDGILLVTRQGTTEKRHLQRGLEAIEQEKLIGAVLNSSKSSADSNYYYRSTNVSTQSAGTTQ
jgi:capsular exopolysaccharide synthesis family protein